MKNLIMITYYEDRKFKFVECYNTKEKAIERLNNYRDSLEGVSREFNDYNYDDVSVVTWKQVYNPEEEDRNYYFYNEYKVCLRIVQYFDE